MRVLVLDDSADEALPMLRALSARQISSAWYTGELKDLPREGEQLRNVRLALLDVDLLGSGGTEKQLVSTLVRTVSRLLSKTTAGLAIVLWTKHPEVCDQLVDELIKTGGPIPIAVTALSKSDYRDGGTGDFDAPKLLTKVEEVLTLVEPWGTILDWERAAREASANVVSGLAELAGGAVAAPTDFNEAKLWRTAVAANLGKMLSRLAQEELGKDNVRNGQTLLQGAFTAIGPWLHDEVEVNAHNLAKNQQAVGELLIAGAGNGALPPGAAAKINRRLSLTTTPVSGCWTGNVYEIGEGSPFGADLDRIYGRAGFRQKFAEMLATGNRSPKPNEVTAREKKLADIAAGILAIVLIDIAPPCDYAQSKSESGRLIAGVRMLATVAESNSVDLKLGNIWSFGPLYDPVGKQDYFLIADARRPLVVETKKLTEAATPWSRLRHGVAAALLSHVAGHTTRPGLLRIPAK